MRRYRHAAPSDRLASRVNLKLDASEAEAVLTILDKRADHEGDIRDVTPPSTTAIYGDGYWAEPSLESVPEPSANPA